MSVDSQLQTYQICDGQYFYNLFVAFLTSSSRIEVQQGLEIRGFWFQKKTVQLKTALREVYTYVLKRIFFQKTV